MLPMFDNVGRHLFNLSQLGDIKGLSDFPVPILFKKRPAPPPEQEKCVFLS